MARCRDEGRSASEAVRGFIERELAPPAAAPRPRLLPRLVAGVLLAAAVGAAAAPTLAHPNSAAEFSRLDRNHDGVLTLDEFEGR
jgi:hypothetical protein